MRYLPALLAALSLSGCSGLEHPQRASTEQPLVAAERLIDAFYSFDPKQLRAAMNDAPASQPQLLYYQGWAQGGNYAILDRQPCQIASDSEITCAITVRDDLIAALGTGFWVTDKFHLTIRDGRIVAVRNSSNDPPEFELALKWLQREKPEVMTGPCRGFFAGGPTPGDCVRAVVAGFKAYRVNHEAK
ncbi:hypothetical protein ACFSAG_02140 [Sphingorhabdus buctiana]|uniref:Uncharacterized protein n=1 Tax=Sphingorhabdus buctiana TaxID=1508805 RepID=A0ABW4MB73_9SPHN